MSESNLALLDNFPWHETSLGARENWPVEMRSVLQAIMASDFPICTGWGDEIIQIYNDAYNTIFGDKHPRSFGAPLKESWPEIWPFVSEALGQVWQTGNSLNFQDTMLALAKTGVPEECYFDFSYSAIKDLNDNVIGLMSVATETTSEVISRRRQAVSEINLASQAKSGISAFSGELHAILSENEMDCKAAALFRLSPENGVPINTEWTIRSDGDFVSRMRPIVAAALVGESNGVIELPDDVRGPGLADEACLIPIADGNARLIAALLLVPDALVPIRRSLALYATQISQRVHSTLHALELLETDLQKTRDKMAEQSAMYRFLFENIRDGAIYTSTSGRPNDEEVVLAINDRACQMLGYDSKEVVGMQRSSFFFPEDEELLSALRERNSKGIYIGDLTFRAKDGTPVELEVTSNIVEIAAGETRSVTVLRDLAERRARDRERQERMRTEATASLTRAVAHDFNNLLTVILTSLEMLEENLPHDDNHLRLVQSASLAAEQAGSITSKLLAFSSRTPTKPRPLQIGTFLEEIKPLLILALGGASTLEIDVASNDCYCWADTSALTSSLINLVTNASHAMPDGGVLSITATVAVKKHLHPSHDAYELPHDRYWAIHVRDEGDGIPDQARDKVFEPFFSTKEVGDGTGLGLPTVLETIREIGGDVRLAPKQGKGEEFSILLPLLDPGKPEINLTSEFVAPQGRVVLYVEDNILVREQTVKMLQLLGFSPLVAKHGREALEYAKDDRQIDIALTDLIMPRGMSGRTLARELKRLRPELPVVITTGYDPEDGTNGTNAGRVLRKPYSREELAEALTRNLEAIY